MRSWAAVQRGKHSVLIRADAFQLAAGKQAGSSRHTKLPMHVLTKTVLVQQTEYMRTSNKVWPLVAQPSKVSWY